MVADYFAHLKRQTTFPDKWATNALGAGVASGSEAHHFVGILDTQLLLDVGAVRLDRLDTQVQAGGDLRAMARYWGDAAPPVHDPDSLSTGDPSKLPFHDWIAWKTSLSPKRGLT